MAIWLGALFSSFAGMFATWMANKTFFATAVIVGFLSLTATFIAALHALSASLYGSLPSWVVGVGYFIPDNAALCFSIWTSASIARWIYDFHMDGLRTASGV